MLCCVVFFECTITHFVNRSPSQLVLSWPNSHNLFQQACDRSHERQRTLCRNSRAPRRSAQHGVSVMFRAFYEIHPFPDVGACIRRQMDSRWHRHSNWHVIFYIYGIFFQRLRCVPYTFHKLLNPISQAPTASCVPAWPACLPRRADTHCFIIHDSLPRASFLHTPRSLNSTHAPDYNCGRPKRSAPGSLLLPRNTYASICTHATADQCCIRSG